MGIKFLIFRAQLNETYSILKTVTLRMVNSGDYNPGLTSVLRGGVNSARLGA